MFVQLREPILRYLERDVWGEIVVNGALSSSLRCWAFKQFKILHFQAV